MNSVVSRIAVPVLCFIAGFLLHGESPNLYRGVLPDLSTTSSPPAPSPAACVKDQQPAPPPPAAHGGATGAGMPSVWSGATRGEPVGSVGITPEARLPESSDPLGPLAESMIAQCKAVMQPDWLGGHNFQEAGLTVKPVLGPGEWSHSDKTTKPMNHHSYESIYEKYFGLYKYGREYAGKKIKVLEVGIGPAGTAKGYRLYKAYLPTIEYYGMELQNQLKQFATSGVNSAEEAKWLESHVMVGDQSSHADRATVNTKWGPFDVIIDDGSHQSGMQVATFKHMFLDALKPGGTFIVEDLETSFGDHVPADRRAMTAGTLTSFVRFTTDLINGLHFHWFNHPKFDPCARSSPQTLEAGVKIYPELLEWIQTIECDREICVFRKRREKLVPRYQGGRKC